MMINLEWFQLMVYLALGVTCFSPLLLLALFFNDWNKDQLW